MSRISDFASKETYTLSDVAVLADILRGEGGCSWDREQTHKSVRNAMIEEAYEAVEGIDLDDKELLKEELGDVLFQVFFHAQIEKEQGGFSVDDVADGICKKMVLRHPHVFGDVTVNSTADVLNNWDKIKTAEKSRDTLQKQLDSVPACLPSLIRAEKLLSRAKKNGVAVEKDVAALIKTVREHTDALDEGVTAEKVGKLLFAVANLTYAAKVNAEQALYTENEAYIRLVTEESR